MKRNTGDTWSGEGLLKLGEMTTPLYSQQPTTVKWQFFCASIIYANYARPDSVAYTYLYCTILACKLLPSLTTATSATTPHVHLKFINFIQFPIKLRSIFVWSSAQLCSKFGLSYTEVCTVQGTHSNVLMPIRSLTLYRQPFGGTRAACLCNGYRWSAAVVVAI